MYRIAPQSLGNGSCCHRPKLQPCPLTTSMCFCSSFSAVSSSSISNGTWSVSSRFRNSTTTSAGSEWTISYCLIRRTVTTQYKGYPDFILRKYTGIGATYVLTGVGEAQSDQNDVTLQGGIYTVGQFRKRECGRKVCCIALLKNKSMNILVAELKDPTPTGSSLLLNVLGEVT